MGTPDQSLEKFVYKPEVLEFPLKIPSAEDLGNQREIQDHLDWLDAMRNPPSPKEEALARERYLEREFMRLRLIRPTRSGEPPPINVTGMDRLVQMYWGSELLDMSLVFIAGKQRFADVVPAELTPDFMSRTSLAQMHALYVLCISSLYWTRTENDIDEEGARTKVSDIVWAFRLSRDHTNWIAEDYSRDQLEQAINDYHGKYSPFQPRSFDGSPATKASREILRNRPVEAPPRLKTWLIQPLTLLSSFRIASSVPLSCKLQEQDRSKYIRFY